MTAAERKETVPAPRFCSACGERLGANARFCAGCGQAVGTAPAAAASLRDQLPGLLVLTLFLVAGLVIWVGVLEPGAPTSSAPGRGWQTASTGTTSTGAASGEMPGDHPPVALPDEAKKFVAQLAEKAKADPKKVDVWKSLAQVQARAAEMEPSYGPQALESWQHVLSLAPDDGDAIRGIGNVYYDQQKFDLAAQQYEKYLAANKDDASVRTDLATAYLYQRQIDKAITTYQEAIAARPSFLQAHFNLGLAWEAKGEREKALASLDKAHELATDDDTRTRIERVKAQLATTPPGTAAAGTANAGNAPSAGGGMPGGAPAGGAGGLPQGAHGPAVGSGPAPSGTDYPSQVEAQLRAHQILGPKIQSVEWPSPDTARVLVADFPMQSMPEFARNLFKTRLETIITDAKQKFSVTDPRTIEIADAATGTTMETVSKCELGPSMQEEFYSEYSEIEDTHWWFRGRREIFTRLLEPLTATRLAILDIGFGTGAMLKFLERYGTVIGMDMALEAIRFARTRVDCPMLLGSITNVPIENASVDLVTAFDIIEHVEDDAAAFHELARVCRPGGHVLVTVPAFQFLWGNQDIVSHHRRRYTLAELGAHVRAAGFTPVRLSYFNAILFPAVAAVRVARRLRGEPKGEVKSDFTMTKPGLVNDTLTRVFAAEGWWLARWRLPVGVSLVCLAERRA